MLVPIFQKHNDEIAALVPAEFSAGTLERYKTSLSHTIEFLKWKYSISDIDIREINHEFIMDYDFYLRSVRKCANNTTVKYIKNHYCPTKNIPLGLKPFAALHFINPSLKAGVIKVKPLSIGL